MSVYVREHHVKRNAELLGNVRWCETGRICDDGVCDEGCLVIHFTDH
jgi:hypothetical protein